VHADRLCAATVMAKTVCPFTAPALPMPAELVEMCRALQGGLGQQSLELPLLHPGRVPTTSVVWMYWTRDGRLEAFAPARTQGVPGRETFTAEAGSQRVAAVVGPVWRRMTEVAFQEEVAELILASG